MVGILSKKIFTTTPVISNTKNYHLVVFCWPGAFLIVYPLALEFTSACSLQNSVFELQDLIFLQNVMKINKQNTSRTTQRCYTRKGIISLCVWCVVRELNPAPFHLDMCRSTVKRVPEVFTPAWTIRSSQMFTRWREHRLSEFLVPRAVGKWSHTMLHVPSTKSRQ